jgi:hypothetical protein
LGRSDLKFSQVRHGLFDRRGDDRFSGPITRAVLALQPSHLDSPKLGNGESAAFFPIFTTTVEGIKYVDPLLIGAAASLAASERDIFRYVVLPATLPNIITGLRIGFGLSFFVIVAAEFIPADSGLGFIDGTRR